MEWYHILGIILGNASFMIPLFLWSRAESRTDYRHLEITMNAIRQEMKDFHGKLEKQDVEFKSSVLSLVVEKLRRE